MNSQGLYGKDEKSAAAKLGVSVHTMRAWRCRGIGPVYAKVGRRVLYLDQDLDAYLAACRVNPVNVAGGAA